MLWSTSIKCASPQPRLGIALPYESCIPQVESEWDFPGCLATRQGQKQHALPKIWELWCRKKTLSALLAMFIVKVVTLTLAERLVVWYWPLAFWVSSSVQCIKSFVLKNVLSLNTSKSWLCITKFDFLAPSKTVSQQIASVKPFLFTLDEVLFVTVLANT